MLPYRLSSSKKELLKTQIYNLFANGIIEECESPYSAPDILTSKTNGRVRFYVDYRKLNAMTIPDKVSSSMYVCSATSVQNCRVNVNA